MAGSFIFGKGQQYASPEELAKARALAEAMLGPQRAPQNVGEGLTAIGQAIRGRIDMNRIGKAEAAGKSSAAAAFNPIMQALSGKSGQFPPAPSSNSGSGMVAPTGASAEAIRAGLVKRGLPEHAANGILMNLQDESGLNPSINEASPLVPGSRGGFGLAQWTGPRRKGLEAFAAERGVPVDDTDMQLDFLMSELQGPEAGAMKSLAASQDAGSAAAAFARDFLRPAQSHLDSRVAKYLGSGGAPKPAQVASLDPVIGMPPASPTPPSPAGPQAQRVMAAMMDKQPMGGGSPQTVAQALSPEQLPVMAGGSADAIQPGQGGPNMQQLMEAAQNPWLNDQQRGMINMLIEQEQQKSDPLRQMQLQKEQLEIDALRNPRLSPAEQAKLEFDREQFRADQADKTADNDREDAKFKFDQGQAGATTSTKDYDAYAKDERDANRQPLSRLEYEQAVRKAGATNTTVSVGGGDNKQVFDAMAESATSARAAMTGLASLREAKAALDAGIISGAGADWKLALQKVGAGLGVVDPTTIINTETFRSAIAPQVAAMMKATVGSTQISNADREFAEKAAGGSINLDEGSIKRLVDIMGRAGNAAIGGHMDRLNKVYPDGNGFERERALFGVDAPAPEMATPKTGAPTAGAVEDGYRFKGGDPSDPANWEQVR